MAKRPVRGQVIGARQMSAHEKTPGGNRGLKPNNLREESTMNKVTTHPGLYSMVREDCPAWCVLGKRNDGHPVDREGHKGDELLTVVDHASDNLYAGDGDILVALERTTLWHLDGSRAGTSQGLRINDELIPMDELHNLHAALDRVRSALIAAGVTGRF